jgi:hypothetical protein
VTKFGVDLALIGRLVATVRRPVPGIRRRLTTTNDAVSLVRARFPRVGRCLADVVRPLPRSRMPVALGGPRGSLISRTIAQIGLRRPKLQIDLMPIGLGFPFVGESLPLGQQFLPLVDGVLTFRQLEAAIVVAQHAPIISRHECGRRIGE